MNLNSTMLSKLDLPTKAFEVAFRCFVVDVLLGKYSTEASFKAELQRRIQTAKEAGVVLSEKVFYSIKPVLSGKAWKEFWDNVLFIQSCNTQKKHTISHDVTYLKITIMLTYVFQDLFRDYILSYHNTENYVFLSNQYLETRDALSHQGSYIVSMNQAHDCISFIRTGIYSIDTSFFGIALQMRLVQI